MTLLRLRTLLFVAFHDRMSVPLGKGHGCTASRGRMLAYLQCDNASLSHALRHLIAAGYIVEEINERDRRKRCYRVIYDDWDAFARVESVAIESWEERRSPGPRGKVVGRETNNRPADASDERQAIVGPRGKVVGLKGKVVGLEEWKSRAGSKASPAQYTEDYVAEAIEDNSAEAARLAARGGPVSDYEKVGSTLARIERVLGAEGADIDPLAISKIADWLFGAVEVCEYGSPEHGWALRLNEAASLVMQDHGAKAGIQ